MQELHCSYYKYTCRRTYSRFPLGCYSRARERGFLHLFCFCRISAAARARGQCFQSTAQIGKYGQRKEKQTPCLRTAEEKLRQYSSFFVSGVPPRRINVLPDCVAEEHHEPATTAFVYYYTDEADGFVWWLLAAIVVSRVTMEQLVRLSRPLVLLLRRVHTQRRNALP